MSATNIITELPVKTLASPSVPSTATRIRQLTAADIADLLREFQGAQFIIAGVGLPPIEVPLEKCFEFWQHEARPRIVPSEIIDLATFPNHYCYLASDWGLTPSRLPIILLERYH